MAHGSAISAAEAEDVTEGTEDTQRLDLSLTTPHNLVPLPTVRQMNSMYPGQSRRNVYVPPMTSAEEVLWALRVNGRPSPDFVKACIRNYIDIKFARGRNHPEISFKLSLLERELPAYADEFRAVRLEKGLAPSNAHYPSHFEGLRRVHTSTSAAANNRPSPSSLYRANTSTSAASLNPSRVTSGSRPNITTTPTRRPTTTTRPVAEDDEELPPPPYARVDPEPDSTRLLQERLAAEAANTVPSGPPPGVATPPNEPVLVHPTTPPPTSSAAATTPARNAATSPRPAGRQASTPPRIPSDPELRRIWEESQFDEATRISTVAERERLELEEAMRLSLAEAEASGSAAGGTASAQRDFDDAMPGDGSPESRRASSYNPHTGAMGERRRNISDAGEAGDLGGLAADLRDLDMSGTRDQGVSQQYLQPQHDHESQHHSTRVSPQPTGVSLLDDDDNVPLAVTMLTPNKTGAVIAVLAGIEVKPMNLIVVTGAAPYDDLEGVVVSAAKRLDRGAYPLSQIGIQFFQIGDDTETREALQALDDGLSETYGVRDMVDTVPYAGELNAPFIIKTLLGGVSRRQDQHGTQ